MQNDKNNKKNKQIEIFKVHCQGEVGNVVISEIPEILGKTALEKMNFLNKKDDSLRRFLCFEPRANPAMSVNLLFKSSIPNADISFIVLQSDKAHAMSGSNCICVVTALLESGLKSIIEPETIVKLETPAGLIIAKAFCQDRKVLKVQLENVPSFAYKLDLEIHSQKFGKIIVDIAFGGVFYALIDCQQIGLKIIPENAEDLAQAGINLKNEISKQIKVQHPQFSSLDEISYVMFRDLDFFESNRIVKTCTTLSSGRVDRSPCGTGSSANLSTLFARKKIKQNEKITSSSIIGGTFITEFTGISKVGDFLAIIPKITGSAFVFGKENLFIRQDDSFPLGFTLSDLWKN